MNPAVALFADRARAVRSDFHLGERNHDLVAAVVRQLHGLPLAIELAAARVRSIALPEMLELLRGSGHDGAAFGLLARSGPRGADDPRHASMLRVVEWSVDRLAPAERELLQVLAVFRGGATLAALAAVRGLPAAEVAVPLDELVASSVVMLLPGSDGRVRYQPFEPVREVLHLRMAAAQREALATAHLQWMRAWAGSLGLAPSLPGFREELPNLVAALGHAVASGEPRAALAMAADSARALDDLALPDDAKECLLRAISTAEANGAGGDELVSRVQALLAEQCYEAGHAADALALAEQALAGMPAQSRWRADALYTAARLRLRIADDTASTGALIDDGLAAARSACRHELEARLLALRGVLVLRRDRDAAAKIALDRQALAIWRAQGPKPRIPEGLVNLALGLGFAHRPLEQLPLLAQATIEARAQQQQRLLAFAHSVHGYVLADLRRWDESAGVFRECLQTAWTHSAWREWFYGLWNLPRTLVRLGEAERAVQLMGFADRFAAERFGQLGWTDLRERRRTRRLARHVLGAGREAAAWERGRALTTAQAMHLACGPGKP
jgi:predicted ATPase